LVAIFMENEANRFPFLAKRGREKFKDRPLTFVTGPSLIEIFFYQSQRRAFDFC